MVGYFGREEQKKDWECHKVICKAVTALNKKFGVKHITEKVRIVNHHERNTYVFYKKASQRTFDNCLLNFKTTHLIS